MVELFGGAIEASLPSTWRDVSQVRQVPGKYRHELMIVSIVLSSLLIRMEFRLFILDNQEVFQDCTEETGAVLVIEILEYQIHVANIDACSYFLNDLAETNEASSLRIIESSNIIVNLHPDDDSNGEMKMMWFPNLSIPASLMGEQCCACITRGSQKVAQGGREGSTTNNDNDTHWIDVEICVLRLPTVQTDLLITLSTPQRSDAVRSDADAGAVGQYNSGTLFQQILKTVNIKDWSLFAS